MQALRAIAACLGTLAAAAPAADAIDTEQKAAAAALTGLQLTITTPGILSALADQGRAHVWNALAELRERTDPAALMRAPGGLVFACDEGGTLEARMAPTFPRVLRLRWAACKSTDPVGTVHVRNGDAEITMLTATLSPKSVAVLRLGTATQDFVDETFSETDFEPRSVSHDTRSFNLRMAGLVSLQRPFEFTKFTGPYAYEISGFLDERLHTEFPDIEGSAPIDGHFRSAAERLIVAGKFEYTSPFLDRYRSDTRLLWGSLSDATLAAPPAEDAIRVVSFEGLRLREEVDVFAFSQSLTLDGNVSYQPIRSAGNDGCAGGDLSFRTTVPLTARPFGDFLGGELVMNDAAKATIYTTATAPPSLPAPAQGKWLRLQVPGVGTFDHDTPFVLHTLGTVGQCFSP
jgi:hypothetical protein